MIALPGHLRALLRTKDGKEPPSVKVQALWRCPCWVEARQSEWEAPRRVPCGKVLNMMDMTTRWTCTKCAHKKGEQLQGDSGTRLLMMWWHLRAAWSEVKGSEGQVREGRDGKASEGKGLRRWEPM
jgi:hypothetical protein